MRFHSAVGFAVLLALVFTLPGVALASKARVEALGIQPDYVVDRVNTQYYPSALFRHQNLVWAEFGYIGQDSDLADNNQMPELNAADRSMGVYWGNWWEGRIGVFGVEMNESATPLTTALGGGYINRNPNESLNLLWANQWGGTTLGIKLDRSFSQTKETGGFVETIEPYTAGSGGFAGGDNGRQVFNSLMSGLGAMHWNTMGASVGLSFEWEADGNDNVVDLSGAIRTYTFKYETPAPGNATDVYENDNSPSFAFNGRAMLQANPDFTWVPVINFARTDMGWKADSSGTNVATAKNTITAFNIGVAGEWKVRGTDLLIAGVAFTSTSVDFEDADAFDFEVDDPTKFSYVQMPNLFAAFEGNLARWLTIRMGAAKPIYSKFTIEDPGTDPLEKFEVTDAPIQFTVGTGFHFGNFTFDTVVQQDWLFTGGPLNNSYEDWEHNPFLRISGDYRF
jgi:hypothetical protein